MSFFLSYFSSFYLTRAISSAMERCIITSKYSHCRHTSQPPADVSLPFPGHRCGGFDSCVCLLLRQENHRAEVKKHVLPNCVSVCNGVPGKSFEVTLPAWGSPTRRNLKNAWKPLSRGKGSRRGVHDHERDEGNPQSERGTRR